MVGRRKVIASRHRRPISLPPTLGFLAGLEHLDHFAGRVDGAEHHGGLAELLDLIAKVRCNPRSFASTNAGETPRASTRRGSVLPRGAAMVAAAGLRAFITGNDDR